MADGNRIATYRYITTFLSEGTNMSNECPSKSEICNSYNTISKPPYGDELDKYSDTQLVRESDIALGVSSVTIVNNSGGIISFINQGKTYYESDTPANIRIGSTLSCSTTATGFTKILWWNGDEGNNIEYTMTGEGVVVTADYYILEIPSSYMINTSLPGTYNIYDISSYKNEAEYNGALLFTDAPEWLTQLASSATSISIKIEENTDIDNRDYLISGYQFGSNLPFTINFTQRGRRTYVRWEDTTPIEVDWNVSNGIPRKILYDGYYQTGANVVTGGANWVYYNSSEEMIMIMSNEDTVNDRYATLSLQSDNEAIEVDSSTILVHQKRKLVIEYRNNILTVTPEVLIVNGGEGASTVEIVSTSDYYENGIFMGVKELEYTTNSADFDWLDLSGSSVIYQENESDESRSANLILTQSTTQLTASLIVTQVSKESLTTVVIGDGYLIEGFSIYYNGVYVGKTNSNGSITYGKYSGEDVTVTGEYPEKGYRTISGTARNVGSLDGDISIELETSNIYELTIRCNVSEFLIEYNGSKIPVYEGYTTMSIEYGTFISGMKVSAEGYRTYEVDSFTFYKDDTLNIELSNKVKTYSFRNANGDKNQERLGVMSVTDWDNYENITIPISTTNFDPGDELVFTVSDKLTIVRSNNSEVVVSFANKNFDYANSIEGTISMTLDDPISEGKPYSTARVVLSARPRAENVRTVYVDYVALNEKYAWWSVSLTDLVSKTSIDIININMDDYTRAYVDINEGYNLDNALTTNFRVNSFAYKLASWTEARKDNSMLVVSDTKLTWNAGEGGTRYMVLNSK